MSKSKLRWKMWRKLWDRSKNQYNKINQTKTWSSKLNLEVQYSDNYFFQKKKKKIINLY